MNSKLTLSIESNVIKNAKAYAKKQGRSLSNIVEEYLKLVASQKTYNDKTEIDFHPMVEELCGSVKFSNKDSYDDIIKEAKMKRYIKR